MFAYIEIILNTFISSSRYVYLRVAVKWFKVVHLWEVSCSDFRPDIILADDYCFVVNLSSSETDIETDPQILAL
jgi:hypothetical protein